MAKPVYTLKKHPDSGECHLFEGEMLASGGCSNLPKSICKKMNSVNPVHNIFACEDEAGARKKSAEAGRKVCGTCVSHLYTSY